MTIIRNMGKCKNCGDIIESLYRHDFVTCKCGGASVDGGKDYLKRCGNPEDFTELSIIKDIDVLNEYDESEIGTD